MIEQLILHGIGDYVTQNDWMAVNKTKYTSKGYLACLIHALFYSLPFLLIADAGAVVTIFITHFFIDKYRLAIYWIKLINWNWGSKNFGFSDDKPFALSVCLLIIADNVFHLVCNYLAIKYIA